MVENTPRDKMVVGSDPVWAFVFFVFHYLKLLNRYLEEALLIFLNRCFAGQFETNKLFVYRFSRTIEPLLKD